MTLYQFVLSFATSKIDNLRVILFFDYYCFVDNITLSSIRFVILIIFRICNSLLSNQDNFLRLSNYIDFIRLSSQNRKLLIKYFVNLNSTIKTLIRCSYKYNN